MNAWWYVAGLWVAGMVPAYLLIRYGEGRDWWAFAEYEEANRGAGAFFWPIAIPFFTLTNLFANWGVALEDRGREVLQEKERRLREALDPVKGGNEKALSEVKK